MTEFFTELRKNKTGLICFWIICILFLTAVFAPYLAPYDPIAINLDSVKLSPSIKHIFGTDALGRDILSRIIFGSRISLSVGIAATALAFMIGLFFGLVGGYFGGKIDKAVLGLIDVTLAFPGLLLAIGITAVFKGGLITVFIALSLVGWAGFARIIRGEVLSLREKEYVEAARANGCSRTRILIKHIMPNLASVAIILTMMKIGAFILGEASLSFLGLGVEPPYPSWGAMINDGIEYMRSCPWITIFPGLALLVSVLSFNLLGDAFRDYCDPKAGNKN